MRVTWADVRVGDVLECKHPRSDSIVLITRIEGTTLWALYLEDGHHDWYPFSPEARLSDDLWAVLTEAP